MSEFQISLQVADCARADVLVTTTRVYYRFATEDTLDSGESPVGNNGEQLIALLNDAASLGGEPIPESEVSVMVENANGRQNTLSEKGLRKIVDILGDVDEAFGFLRGFL